MTSDNRFSAEARTYARHAHVVDAMHQRFQTDVDQFLNTLRTAIGDDLWSGELQELTTPRYRYWWVETPSYRENAHIWLERYDPKLVPCEAWEGHLVATVGMPPLGREHQARMEQAVRQVVTAMGRGQVTVTPATGSNASVVGVTVTYSPATPIEDIAGPLSEVLRSAAAALGA